MIKKQLFWALLLASLTGSTAWGQNPLSISGSLSAGLLSAVSSDARGDIYSAYDYPLSGISIAASGKLRVSLSTLPVRFIGSVSYNRLFDSAILPVATSSGTVNEELTYATSIIAIGVGLEYPFLNTPTFRPYASLAGSLNMINGSAKYENNVIPEATLNATSRIGIDLGIGTSLDAPFLPLALEVEVKYRLVNVFGKTFDTSGPPLPGFGGLPQTSSYSLNDAKNPNDTRDDPRSITYLVLFVGVNLDIL